MTHDTVTASSDSLDQVIASKCNHLLSLLAQVQDEPDGERGGTVLWGCKSFLPPLASAMARGLYREQGQIPDSYRSATLLAPGWDTALCLFKAEAIRTGRREQAPGMRDYNRGAHWACARLRDEFAARGADTLDEPLNFAIARHALELATLIGQVVPETDASGGGAALFAVRATLPSLARNTNSGLYNYMGLIPAVSNPGYLPPENWRTRLQALRDEPGASGDDPDKHHYFEGIRWTYAKARDMFTHLTEKSLRLAA